MKQRNIALCILYSIITCGIYGIIWFVQITDDAARAGGDDKMSGGMAFLLTLVTCGIYSFYWAYRMGKLVAQAQENKGVRVSDNSILYLVLQLFGLGIVNYCLIQSDLNQLAD